LRPTGANIINRVNIVLLKPGSNSEGLSQVAVSNMIADGDMTADGAVTLLGVWDKHLYNAVIKDRSVSSVSTFTKSATANASAAARPECTAWYLVTRYYDQFGNLTHIEEELVSIDCSGDGTDNGDSSDPDNPGGGSGGNGGSGSGGGDDMDCDAL